MGLSSESLADTITIIMCPIHEAHLPCEAREGGKAVCSWYACLAPDGYLPVDYKFWRGLGDK